MPWRHCDAPASAPSSSRARSSSDGWRLPGRRGLRSTSTCSLPALISKLPRALSPPRAIPPRSTLPSDPGFDHARVWTAPDRVPIELHWTIVGADERLVWEVLADETETAQIAGELVEIPNEAARCLIVALHAAQHGDGAAQTLHDLERALTTAGKDVWVRGLELAVAVGAETPFVAALDLTARGHALRTALGLPVGRTDTTARCSSFSPPHPPLAASGDCRDTAAPRQRGASSWRSSFRHPGSCDSATPSPVKACPVFCSRTCTGCGGSPAGRSQGCAPGGDPSGSCATAGRATSRRPSGRDRSPVCLSLPVSGDSRSLRERGGTRGYVQYRLCPGRVRRWAWHLSHQSRVRRGPASERPPLLVFSHGWFVCSAVAGDADGAPTCVQAAF